MSLKKTKPMVLSYRERRYPVKEEKGYPVDRFFYNRIKKLRNRIVSMRSLIKSQEEVIEVKKKFLEDTYDHIDKEMKKYDEKRRGNKIGRAFKP